jgi:hypothetical protein
MILLADPEEAAERHDGVDRLAAHLVEHDVVDGAELLALHVVDVRSLDLLRRDQAAGRDPGLLAGHACLRWDVVGSNSSPRPTNDATSATLRAGV